MACLHVTTDDGTLIGSWTDRDPDNGEDMIGPTDSRASLERLVAEIASAVERARRLDGRDPASGVAVRDAPAC